MKLDFKLLKETVKEPLRLAVLGFFSILFGEVVKNLLAAPQTETTVAALFVLRFIDSFLHEKGKAEKNPTLVTGLTRF